MIDFTIITTEAELRIEADYYKFAPDTGDLYLYEGEKNAEDGDSVGHVTADRYVAIFETEHGDTQPPTQSA